MQPFPLRTTVIGSYPFPGWLELASGQLDKFGPDDVAEIQDDAALCAIGDQLKAGLDVITDGEQTRLDFNLSFYGYIDGIQLESAPPRRWGPPAHDQRGKHAVLGELSAPGGLGVVEEYRRLERLVAGLPLADHKPQVTLKASVPGPYTLAGRLLSGGRYRDRWELTEALLPIVSRELADLVAAGCREITVDEPSMSCYGYREDPQRFVDIFNRTVQPAVGRTRLSTHLCFGNYKARAVAPRRYAPLYPAFHGLSVDEVHLEMASREFAEIDIVSGIVERGKDVCIGVIDVKSYFIEQPEDVAERVRRCLAFAPPERLSFAPDCGLSQTARWASRRKLANMVAGVRQVRHERGLE